MENNGATKSTFLLAGHQIEAVIDNTADTQDGDTTLNLTVSLSWGGRVSFSVTLPHLPPQPTNNEKAEIQSDDRSPPKDRRRKRKRNDSEKERAQQAKRQHAGETAMAEAKTILSLPPEIMVCPPCLLSLPSLSPCSTRVWNDTTHIRK